MYTKKYIAKELQATADGGHYFGSALIAAYEMHETTQFERAVLNRWLNGSQTSNDRFMLQEIAIKLHQAEE